jgi:hypothetical protein
MVSILQIRSRSFRVLCVQFELLRPLFRNPLPFYPRERECGEDVAECRDECGEEGECGVGDEKEDERRAVCERCDHQSSRPTPLPRFVELHATVAFLNAFDGLDDFVHRFDHTIIAPPFLGGKSSATYHPSSARSNNEGWG